jgi:membrane protein
MTDGTLPSRSPSPPWWPVVALGALALVTWSQPAPSSPGERGEGVPRASVAGDEPGHGRAAEAPQHIPALGWRDIAWRVYASVDDNRLLAVAAGVTFYAILALFPAIAAFVSVYGLFADPATIGTQLDAMNGFLPDGALSIIGEQVKRIAATPHGSLSVALVSSLAISLWSANAGMKAVFDALNVAYQEKEKRSFVALNLRSMAFTLGAIVILILMVAAVVVLPIVLNIIGFASVVALVTAVARWPLMLVVVIAALSILYRYGPSRRPAKWRWIGWGSSLAALLWIAASLGFSFYVGRFGSYNATYGSLGAAIGFMTWIWISAIVILLGAEVSAQIEHQTAMDSTVGAPKPLGARGAVMADEVGAIAR